MTCNRQATEIHFDDLLKLFTLPEGTQSPLSQIDQRISKNLNAFLSDSIAAEEMPLAKIELNFSDPDIPKSPCTIDEHSKRLMDNLIAHAVHTASPSFIGHMTSALPSFLMPLSKLMVALNQNVVKIETSNAFTPLERQVLSMMHKLIYQNNNAFYQQWMHDAEHSLGAFCSGGTIANITALWVARNNALKADGPFKGVHQEGLFSALKHYGYNGLAILVSERGHYSLKKAADLLGIGQQGLVVVNTDEFNRICLTDLKLKLTQLKQQGIKVFAMIGVAGTTETGHIDPLAEMAALCQQEDCHFHVDAAWGGATLLSKTYGHLLKGIELADSVTIDAHKQLYIPMGSGMVMFKSPETMTAIKHHAQYILRKGSKDLGAHTLEGSRSGQAMLLYSALHIIGKSGYGQLIDKSLEKAQYFAQLIKAQDDFELISEPELCLLTYRYRPLNTEALLSFSNAEEKKQLYTLLNALIIYVQKTQRERGKTFVSRTQLNPLSYQGHSTSVFRVVLANPLTTPEILQTVLTEQREIAIEWLNSKDPQAVELTHWLASATASLKNSAIKRHPTPTERIPAHVLKLG